jgi:hypothetical protein
MRGHPTALRAAMVKTAVTLVRIAPVPICRLPQRGLNWTSMIGSHTGGSSGVFMVNRELTMMKNSLPPRFLSQCQGDRMKT